MQELRKKVNIGSIVLKIVLVIVIFFILAFLLSWNSMHINVDLCLQKDTFKKYDDHIEEILGYDVYIIDKGITTRGYKQNGGREYFVVKIPEENNTELRVMVDENIYSSMDVGDYVHFERKVYYTLSGLRLKYEDTLRPINIDD